MNGNPHDNQQLGYETPPPRAPGRNHYKSPVLATVLSLMPGLGQVYVGYYPQGFLNALIVAGVITMLAAGIMRGFEPFLGIFLAFFWVYNMIDANRRAFHYNRAVDGLSGEQLPDDFELPGMKGSTPIGVILVVLGTLIFLDLNAGISMEWLEEWWPLGLVIGGIWLIVRARRRADTP